MTTNETRDTQRTHLTLTGYYAGRVICGAPKTDDNQYLHAAYAPIERLEANSIPGFSPLCEECKRLWDEAAAEDDLEQDRRAGKRG
jgi:hypothetical protein